MAKIPCFLCTKELQKRTDKNNKPYFICDSCGTQIFVRGKHGIENLEELIKTLQERHFPFHEHAVILHKIQATLTEIRGLQKEIQSIEDKFLFLSGKRDSKDRERMLKLLNARIDTLFAQLESYARGDKMRQTR